MRSTLWREIALCSMGWFKTKGGIRNDPLSMLPSFPPNGGWAVHFSCIALRICTPTCLVELDSLTDWLQTTWRAMEHTSDSEAVCSAVLHQPDGVSTVHSGVPLSRVVFPWEWLDSMQIPLRIGSQHRFCHSSVWISVSHSQSLLLHRIGLTAYA